MPPARDRAALAFVSSIPAPSGDDRWDAARTPETPMERGQVERAWVELFAVPRERVRRLRGILDYFWDAGLTPYAVLYAAAYDARAEGPWKSPMALPAAPLLAERFCCSPSPRNQAAAAMAWRLAYWLDDHGRPLPPPT